MILLQFTVGFYLSLLARKAIQYFLNRKKVTPHPGHPGLHKINNVQVNPEVINYKSTITMFIIYVFLAMPHILLRKFEYFQNFSSLLFHIIDQTPHLFGGFFFPITVFVHNRKIRNYVGTLYWEYLLDILKK